MDHEFWEAHLKAGGRTLIYMYIEGLGNFSEAGARLPAGSAIPALIVDESFAISSEIVRGEAIGSGRMLSIKLAGEILEQYDAGRLFKIPTIEAPLYWGTYGASIEDSGEYYLAGDFDGQIPPDMWIGMERIRGSSGYSFQDGDQDVTEITGITQLDGDAWRPRSYQGIDAGVATIATDAPRLWRGRLVYVYEMAVDPEGNALGAGAWEGISPVKYARRSWVGYISEDPLEAPWGVELRALPLQRILEKPIGVELQGKVLTDEEIAQRGIWRQWPRQGGPEYWFSLRNMNAPEEPVASGVWSPSTDPTEADWWDWIAAECAEWLVFSQSTSGALWTRRWRVRLQSPGGGDEYVLEMRPPWGHTTIMIFGWMNLEIPPPSDRGAWNAGGEQTRIYVDIPPNTPNLGLIPDRGRVSLSALDNPQIFENGHLITSHGAGAAVVALTWAFDVFSSIDFNAGGEAQLLLSWHGQPHEIMNDLLFSTGTWPYDGAPEMGYGLPTDVFDGHWPHIGGEVEGGPGRQSLADLMGGHIVLEGYSFAQTLSGNADLRLVNLNVSAATDAGTVIPPEAILTSGIGYPSPLEPPISVAVEVAPDHTIRVQGTEAIGDAGEEWELKAHGVDPADAVAKAGAMLRDFRGQSVCEIEIAPWFRVTIGDRVGVNLPGLWDWERGERLKENRWGTVIGHERNLCTGLQRITILLDSRYKAPLLLMPCLTGMTLTGQGTNEVGFEDHANFPTVGALTVMTRSGSWGVVTVSNIRREPAGGATPPKIYITPQAPWPALAEGEYHLVPLSTYPAATDTEKRFMFRGVEGKVWQ